MWDRNAAEDAAANARQNMAGHLPQLPSLCVLFFREQPLALEYSSTKVLNLSISLDWFANVQLVNDMSDHVVLLANTRSGALKDEQRKGSVSGEQAQQLFL